MKVLYVAIITVFCQLVIQSATSLAHAASPLPITQALDKNALASESSNVALKKVNLNIVDDSAITTAMSEISARKAKALVTFRIKNGKFSSFSDLKKIQGFGRGFFCKYQDKIEKIFTLE